MASLDALDTKAQAMLAGAVAEVGFLVALLALRPSEQHKLSVLSGRLLFVAVVVAVVAVVLAWMGQRVRKWDSYPSTDNAWKVAHQHTQTYTWQMGLSLVTAYIGNLDGRRRKTRLVKAASVAVLVLTLVALAAGIAIVTT